MARLRDLDARLKGTATDGWLNFDCPVCAGIGPVGHQVRVRISDQPTHADAEGNLVWQASGEFPDSLTLSPSIDVIEVDGEGKKVGTSCWHGFVKDGDAT